MSNVLVLDAEQRSSLAVVRSLAQQGVCVHVAGISSDTLAGSSRFTTSRRQYPDPQNQPAAFVKWVEETIDDLGGAKVFPLTDVTTMLLASDPGTPRAGKMLCAPRDAYESVTDKSRLTQLALEVGVQIPATRMAATRAQIEEYALRGPFPLILKPARSRVLLAGRIVSTAVAIARSPSDVQTFLDKQTWLDTMPCLIQEFIPGHGAGVFGFYRDGEPLAWFAHRRIREKPPQGGVSVLSESTTIDARLRDAAERLLTHVKWDGAAMVEFRIGENGIPYLMEINGRLWGSLQLAIDSGIDFPALIYRATQSGTIQASSSYEVGRRLRWFMGDVDNLLLELRGKGLARTPTSRLRAIARFAATTLDPRAHNEIFRFRDVKPAIFELRNWFAALRGSK